MAEPSYRDVFMRLPEARKQRKGGPEAPPAGLRVAGGGSEVLEAVEEEEARYG